MQVQGALAERVLLEFRTYRLVRLFLTLISWGCLFQHSFEAFGGLCVDQTGLGQALLLCKIWDETFRNGVVLVSSRKVEFRRDEASDFCVLGVLEVVLIIRLQKRRWRSHQHVLVPILYQHTIWVDVHQHIIHLKPRATPRMLLQIRKLDSVVRSIHRLVDRSIEHKSLQVSQKLILAFDIFSLTKFVEQVRLFLLQLRDCSFLCDIILLKSMKFFSLCLYRPFHVDELSSIHIKCFAH